MGFGRSGCCFHTLLQDVCDGGKSQRPARDLAVAAKSLQSCPTLCDPIDGSSPGSPVPGILQARTPEWVYLEVVILIRSFLVVLMIFNQLKSSKNQTFLLIS